MATEFDAIVVGGGHNGLACAAYLGRAGRRVAVVEARPLLGGFTTTECPFEHYPEVRSPMAAMDLATANMPPSIIDELGLRDYGLELLRVDPFYSHVAPDGTSLLFWRDLDRTCAEIARYSLADAAAYRELTYDMAAFWRVLAPYMHAHPTRPGAAAVLAMLGRSISAVKPLGRAARMMMMSPRALLDSAFENDRVRAALGNFAAASTAPLDQPGSGLILGLMAMQHEWGVTRPVGGMGSFADSLVALGRSLGVTYYTGVPASRIRIAFGRANGVCLADGREFGARHVIGALDPRTLMTRLLPDEHLPEKVRRELAAMTVLGGNIASARVDLLLSDTPRMVVGEGRAATILPTSMLIGPDTLDETQAYVLGCARGELRKNPPVWAASPSMLDRSLVAAHADRQTLYVYVPAVPFRLTNGQPWAERRDELGDKVVATLATVMPGVGELILDRSVRTPAEFESVSGLDRGCLYHVDMSLAQMGPWRPTPSLAGYRTPVRGLWHSGAGAHPMGSVNGIAGKLAAREVLRADRSGR